MTLDQSEHLWNMLIAAALTAMGGMLVASLMWYSVCVTAHAPAPTILTAINDR